MHISLSSVHVSKERSNGISQLTRLTKINLFSFSFDVSSSRGGCLGV